MSIENELKHQKIMSEASGIVSAKQFWAIVAVSYIDVNTEQICEADLTFTDKDPEFQQMVNQWAARKLAEQLLKQGGKQ